MENMLAQLVNRPDAPPFLNALATLGGGFTSLLSGNPRGFMQSLTSLRDRYAPDLPQQASPLAAYNTQKTMPAMPMMPQQMPQQMQTQQRQQPMPQGYNPFIMPQQGTSSYPDAEFSRSSYQSNWR